MPRFRFDEPRFGSRPPSTAGGRRSGWRRALSWFVMSWLVVGAAAVSAPARAAEATQPGGGAAGQAAATPGKVTFSGRGWGHGRGMGQYGALGYAVDHGWDAPRILNHFYSGTSAASAGNPVIGVELLRLTGKPLIATGSALALNGKRIKDAAIMVTRSGSGTFSVQTGPGCAGPWSAAGSVSSGALITSAAYTANRGSHVQLCEPGGTRGYRGQLRAIDTGSQQASVNEVRLEDYLKGVVPRESPASWASLGGGKGMQALRAQAVAARSYAISSPRSGWATTCDTTACQVYGGEFVRGASGTRSLEDSRTNSAVAATAGVVRKHANGRVARTEFSSSTGGHTAGGTFPAVRDDGDDIRSNPNRSWSTSLSWADAQSRLGVPGMTKLSVSRRNGLGADGGRVLQVTAVDAQGRSKTFTGKQAKSKLRLKSDWFSIKTTAASSMTAAQAQALTTGVYRDFLGREPTPDWMDRRVRQLRDGYPQAAFVKEVAFTQERLEDLVWEDFPAAMGRDPDGLEVIKWARRMRETGSRTAVRAEILASEKAVAGSGGQAEWLHRGYRLLLGRDATAAELTLWGARVNSTGYESVAPELVASHQAANRRLQQYYRTFLGRNGGTPADLSRMARDGDFSIPIRLAASREYFNRVT
ncbi:MAG: hypothetical protein CSA58_02360 [Micrococcales bacterium]|nr:MAG: hypothetical protein CSB46_05580 [Micrococcales bacterium]PIE27822.1 MAG: hypothetical protein CSA58_02360 [Micrococcales bacterium]